MPRGPGEVRAPIGLPPKLAEIAIEQKLGAQVPGDIAFADETGKTVRLADYFGTKPTILVLAYFRCPNLCDQTINSLLERLRHQKFSFTAGKEFQILTVSFDHRERPELAAAKKENYVLSYGRPGVASGWHFLTGEEANIRRLADSVGFHYRWEPEKEQYAHASGIMLLTPEGKVSRYFLGVGYNGGDLRLGLIEASNQRIGSPVDRLMLLCFPYDGATGKYTLSVLTLVRATSVLTVLVLLGCILRAVRRGTPVPDNLPTAG
jgi:protein SCO1/2